MSLFFLLHIYLDILHVILSIKYTLFVSMIFIDKNTGGKLYSTSNELVESGGRFTGT